MCVHQIRSIQVFKDLEIYFFSLLQKIITKLRSNFQYCASSEHRFRSYSKKQLSKFVQYFTSSVQYLTLKVPITSTVLEICLDFAIIFLSKEKLYISRSFYCNFMTFLVLQADLHIIMIFRLYNFIIHAKFIKYQISKKKYIY